MSSSKSVIHLIPGQFYHLFNRAINKDKLFYSDKNYIFFLQRFSYFMSDFIQTFAFCLIPNHFHFLIKVKEKVQDELIVSKQLRKFFISYTMSLNKSVDRHGNLFERPFKRKLITSNEYFQHLIYYIHNNPVKHGLVSDLPDWQFSSYNRILIPKKTNLEKDEVLDYFGGKDNYVDFHEKDQDLGLIEKFMIE